MKPRVCLLKLMDIYSANPLSMSLPYWVVVLFLPVSFWVEFSWDGEGFVAGGHAGALGPERR